MVFDIGIRFSDEGTLVIMAKLHQKQDGSYAVQNKDGSMAGTLPSDGVRHPSAGLAEEQAHRLSVIRHRIQLAKAAGDSTGVEEAYQQLSTALREVEESGEEVELSGFAVTGERPAAVAFGMFDDEPDDMILPPGHGEGSNEEHLPMRPLAMSEAQGNMQTTLAMLSVAVAQGQPVMLEGAPGIGKTQKVHALGRQLDAEVIDLNGAQTPADELLGQSYVHLPEGGTPEDASVPKIPPAWVRKIQNNPHKRFIVFLDEFTNAPPSVRAALLTVIQDRKVGEHMMGSNVTFIAAANPAEYATNGYELDPATSNRFLHVKDDPSPEEMIDGLMHGWYEAPSAACTRAEYEEQYAFVKDISEGFLKSSAGVLVQVPTDEDDENYGHGWPSLRSWSGSIKLIARARAAGASTEVVRRITVGMLGKKVTPEFMQYMAKQDLPPIEDILRNPSGWNPDNPDVMARGFAGVIKHLQQSVDESGKNTKPEEVVAALQVCVHLAELGRSDLVAGQIRPILEMSPVQTPGSPIFTETMKLTKKLMPLLNSPSSQK